MLDVTLKLENFLNIKWANKNNLDFFSTVKAKDEHTDSPIFPFLFPRSSTCPSFITSTSSFDEQMYVDWLPLTNFECRQYLSYHIWDELRYSSYKKHTTHAYK